MEHFVAEAKPIIDTWDRVDTGGGHVTLFRKGEEMLYPVHQVWSTGDTFHFLPSDSYTKARNLPNGNSAAMIQHTSPTQKVSVPIPGANVSLPHTTPRKHRKKNPMMTHCKLKRLSSWGPIS